MIRVFELNKNLLKVGDNYVCVNNDKIGLNDWFVFTWCREHTIQKCTEDKVSEIDHRCKKIIFSTKFIHESIPLLNLESEEAEVFKMASENILTSSGFVNTENEMDVAYSFFHNGYQKAKETFKYTEDDLRKAIEMARDITDGKETFTGEDASGFTEMCAYGWKEKFSDEEIIHSLQKPKEIKSIEVEYIRQERIEKLLSIPLEKLSLIDSLGDKNCKTCSGHGCVDIGNDFGCTIDYCENCYPAETPTILPNGKIKCKINY